MHANLSLQLPAHLLEHLPCQILLIDENARILYANAAFRERWNRSETELAQAKLAAVFPKHSLFQMLSAAPDTQIMFREDDAVCFQSSIWDQEKRIGALHMAIPVSTQLPDSPFSASYEDFGLDLNAIFHSSYDVIYASDGRGITTKVSAACEKLWGLPAKKMIGRSIYDLEKEGVYKPSITRLVLEKKQRVQAFQVTKTARKLMVIGTPIKNQHGEIVQVINVSRDITKEQNMKIELDSIKLLLDAYKHELDALRAKNRRHNQFIHASEAMTNVAQMALKVSAVDSTVLITGETGVGKEIVASFIHTNSCRKEKPYIKINCGAIPASLLESELFGYEKGAFTGANKEGKLGLFELANDGTLFLDEVTELPLNMQVKLLRVLQDGAFLRVGGTRPVRVDVRIIAACNRNLDLELEKGRFREDLYYRLNVVPIYIPPLRKRPDDILPLTTFFLDRFNRQYGKNKTLEPEIIQRLQEFHWPGNIRELQNVLERLIVLTDRDTIALSDLPDYIMAGSRVPGIVINRLMPLKEAVGSVEQQLIQLAMKKYGSTTRAAEALGVDQSTVSRKIKNYNL